MQAGLREILDARSVPYVFVGHPSMAGLFLTDVEPTNYRDWVKTDGELYETLALYLHDLGILCEPDCREPFFLSAAHDDTCLKETVEKFAIGLDAALKELGRS
jgi:glutamate-1-semialdehyde 2,1-aminomutase